MCWLAISSIPETPPWTRAGACSWWSDAEPFASSLRIRQRPTPHRSSRSSARATRERAHCRSRSLRTSPVPVFSIP